jgi:hypothetical protein
MSSTSVCSCEEWLELPLIERPQLLCLLYRHFDIAGGHGLSGNLDPLLVRFTMCGQYEWKLINRDSAVRSYAQRLHEPSFKTQNGLEIFAVLLVYGNFVLCWLIGTRTRQA